MICMFCVKEKQSPVAFRLMLVFFLLSSISFQAAANSFLVIPERGVISTSSPKRVYAEFSIVNDTGQDYFYYMAGSVEIIKKGNTRTFSCPDGIDVFHCEKETKAKLWFTITPAFNKQVFSLSEMLKKDLFVPKLSRELEEVKVVNE